MDIFELFNKIETASPSAKLPITAMIVGLGNTGAQYERTRHNAGFLAIDAIAGKAGAKIDRLKFHALVGECTVAGRGVLLMKPQTLMNNSGVAVEEAAAFYKIAPENILVLVDDICFAPGKIRIRRKGSAGGHNGLKSIIAHLGSDAFPRIRIGIGEKPHPDADLADWVLSRFTEEEMKALQAAFVNVNAAAEAILSGDIEGAMCRYSG